METGLRLAQRLRAKARKRLQIASRREAQRERGESAYGTPLWMPQWR